MALPTTRAAFKEYCLRKLGKPVIQINVADEQVEDRIDQALAYWNDYHFDGSDKIYLKHQMTANNRGDAVHSLTLVSGGTLYSNADTVVFTGGGGASAFQGTGATGSITTDANGTIISVSLDSNGSNYHNAPTVTISTSTGSGAEITAELGGWVPIPDEVIGIIDIFDMGAAFNTGNMFSVTYQFFLNEMYNLANSQLTNYYMSMQHIRLIEEILIGKQPIRYNRHKDRLYLDINWDRFTVGNFIIAHCYEKINPDKYPDLWKDRWLLQYTTALIKQQWGSNLTKFIGGTLPGGMQFNGEKILNDATREIETLEQRMSYDIMGPPQDFVG